MDETEIPLSSKFSKSLAASVICFMDFLDTSAPYSLVRRTLKFFSFCIINKVEENTTVEATEGQGGDKSLVDSVEITEDGGNNFYFLIA